MKCAIPACPGEYEEQSITHKVQESDGEAYIDNVPAHVCVICGDTIIATEVLEHIEKILKGEIEPKS